MRLAGFATKDGTAKYQSCMGIPAYGVHNVFGLSLSAIGVGTYLGTADSQTDILLEDALTKLLSMGCNVIDCAPNYRDMRSEKCVGKVLSRLAARGLISRNAIFVATKVGLVPENRILPPALIAGPEYSCFDPEWIKISLKESLERLNLETLDCVFIHNLELLRISDPDKFYYNYSILATCMENIVEQGLARSWGISSWNGFRVPEDHVAYLSLDKLRAGNWPHLRYLQLPLGLWGSEAITGAWQNGKSILESAPNMAIFANSPLLQGELANLLAERPENIEKAILFVRDTANVAVTLLGMKQEKHIKAWKRMQCSFYRQADILDNFPF